MDLLIINYQDSKRRRGLHSCHYIECAFTDKPRPFYKRVAITFTVLLH